MCNWLGAFPVVYDKSKMSFSTSKSGMLITSVHVVIVGLQIHSHLMMLFFGSIKKTSAVTSIVLSANALGLLYMLVKRMMFVSDTVRCYNSLSDWPADISVRKSSVVIMYASAVAVLIEFVGETIDR